MAQGSLVKRELRGLNPDQNLFDTSRSVCCVFLIDENKEKRVRYRPNLEHFQMALGVVKNLQTNAMKLLKTYSYSS